MTWFDILNSRHWSRTVSVYRNLSILSLLLVVVLSEKGCSSLQTVEVSETGRSVRIAVKKHAKDVTTELNAFIQSAQANNIDTIVLSQGVYRIAAPLYIYPGLVLSGDSKYKTIIEQITWGHPAFDLLDTDSCSISNMTILTHQDRQYPNGFIWRGGDAFVGNAGIYSNSHHGTFKNLVIKGFSCGIFLSSWDGAGLYEQKLHNTIEDVEVDSVDFGLLITGQKDLNVAHIRGKYVRQGGFTGSPHLIYISGANDTLHAWTEDFTLKHCRAFDGIEGSAYQIGSARRGQITDLYSDNCMGILSGGNWQQLTFDSLVALNDQTHEVGSIFIRPLISSNVRMTNIVIQSDNPEARLLLLNGTNNVYSNIQLKSATNRIWDHNIVVFEGEDSILKGLSLESPSDSVGAVAVLLAGKNLVLENLSCTGCRAGFNIHQSCDECTVRIDPRKIVAPLNYPDFRLYFDYSAKSHITNISQ